MHILVVADDIYVINEDVYDGAVLEVLPERANSDAVAAMTCHILDRDPITSRLDCNAIITALVPKVF